MDVIFEFAAWYKAVFDKFFAMIGFNVETAEGIIVIAIGIIVLHFAGSFFGELANRFNDK